MPEAIILSWSRQLLMGKASLLADIGIELAAGKFQTPLEFLLSLVQPLL